MKYYQRPASATKVDILNALKEALKLSDEFLSVLPLPQMLQENDEKKKRPTIRHQVLTEASYIEQLEDAKKKIEDDEEMKRKRMEEREKKRAIKEKEMMIKAMKREEKKGKKITTKRKARAQENQIGVDDENQVVNETENNKRKKSSESEDLSLPKNTPSMQTDETEEGQRNLDDDGDKASRRSSRLRKPRVYDDFIIFNDVIIIDDERAQQPEPQPSTSTDHYTQDTTELGASTLDGDSYHSDDDDDDDHEVCIMCGQFRPEGLLLEAGLRFVDWGQCDNCSGWVHLRYCTPVQHLGPTDQFVCPRCNEE